MHEHFQHDIHRFIYSLHDEVFSAGPNPPAPTFSHLRKHPSIPEG